MQNPNEKPTPEITEEVVENALVELKESSVLPVLRSLIQGDNNFFNREDEENTDTWDSEQESGERTTGSVFNEYIEAIRNEQPLALKRLEEPEMRNAMLSALEKDSVLRIVLLAYYGVTEETPWEETEQIIPSRQLFNNDNFPSAADIERVLDKVVGSN